MKRVLVAYATFAGSTPDVARAVGEVLSERGLAVDVLPVDDGIPLDGYDAVVVGGPMILGWHRAARRFLRKRRRDLAGVPLAVFATAMSLTRTGESEVDGIPVFVDPKLPRPPERVGELTFRERYSTIANYGRPILKAAQPAKPVSLGFFGGRLDYGRLKWWAVLFAMVMVRAQAGDRRNWEAVRSWARDVGELISA